MTITSTRRQAAGGYAWHDAHGIRVGPTCNSEAEAQGYLDRNHYSPDERARLELVEVDPRPELPQLPWATAVDAHDVSSGWFAVATAVFLADEHASVEVTVVYRLDGSAWVVEQAPVLSIAGIREDGRRRSGEVDVTDPAVALRLGVALGQAATLLARLAEDTGR